MPTRILLPIDLETPDIWSRAIDTAIDLARRYRARLLVVWVTPPVEADPADLPETLLPALHEFVAERFPDDIMVEAHLRSDWGDPDREICSAAEKLRCDLIVIGTHDPQLGEAAASSNAASVALHAKCSVYVVR